MTGSSLTRVLVVDDDAGNRRILRELLETQRLEVVGEASDGAEAVELAEKLLPDVVLMDVRMPVMDGIEATRLITGSVPRSRVIVLTSHDDPALRRRAEEAGASAYILKGGSAGDIRAAIEGVVRSRAD